MNSTWCFLQQPEYKAQKMTDHMTKNHDCLLNIVRASLSLQSCFKRHNFYSKGERSPFPFIHPTIHFLLFIWVQVMGRISLSREAQTV